MISYVQLLIVPLVALLDIGAAHAQNTGDTEATLREVASRYGCYAVDVVQYQYLLDLSMRDTSRSRIVYDSAHSISLIKYVEGKVRLLRNDSLMMSDVIDPDSLNFTLFPPTVGRAMVESRLGESMLPHKMADDLAGWQAIDAGAGAAGQQVMRFRKTTDWSHKTMSMAPVEPTAPNRSEDMLEMDGQTGHLIAQQHDVYRDGELTRSKRVEYSNWDMTASDPHRPQYLALPVRVSGSVEQVKRVPISSIVKKGEQVPPLRGVNLAGDSVTVDAANTILFFSFIGCTPCAMALSDMKDAEWRLKRGARLVYINDRDSPSSIEAYVKRKFGADAFEVLLPAEDVSETWAVHSYPTFVRVDGKGIVRSVHSGYGSRYRKKLLK